MESIKSSATISQLEEVVLQEERNVQDFHEKASQTPSRKDEFLECAALASVRKEEAELAIKAIKEAAQYTEFGKDQDSE